MCTPVVVSIGVIEDNGTKKFRLPDGSLSLSVFAGEYASYKPYRCDFGTPLLEREIDTPLIVFRNEEYYDSGVLECLRDESGYRVVGDFANIRCGDEDRSYLHAIWFKSGDVLSFVRLPSLHEIENRKQ